MNEHVESIIKRLTYPSRFSSLLRFLPCLVVLFAAIGWANTQAQAEEANKIFEFHSGFWINLHHFLYWQALSTNGHSAKRSLQLRDDDLQELKSLTPEEHRSWDVAVTYYANQMIHRDLLFDRSMEEIKNELENAETESNLTNASIPSELKTVLLAAAPVYQKHWWAKHNARNQLWIRQLLPLVGTYGIAMRKSLAKIYETPWPSQPIRVDTVAYANWAGAYTTLGPTRPTISTTDQANQGIAALEIVFHESSHGMIDRVMKMIDAQEKLANTHTGNREIHFRRDLWHELLFYTAGKLVAEQIPGYLPYADKNGLWKRAWSGPDHELIERDWGPHVDGRASLQDSLAKLIDDLVS